MADERGSRNLFSEKEVGRILKRATELQEDEGPAVTMGLSLSEVEQIATEMGVDPRYVAAAVAEVEQDGGDDEQFYWLGAPVFYEMERVVEGEVSVEQWEEMVDAIRRSFNTVGVSGQVGRRLEWTHNSRRRQIQVRAISREGKTRLRIYSRFPKMAAILFAIPLALSVQAVVLLMERLVFPGAASLLIGILGVMFLLLRLVFDQYVKKKKRNARRLLNQLEQLIVAPMSTTAALPVIEQHRMEASLLTEDAAPVEASPPVASRSRTS